jgi:hypothetical protein
MLCVGRRHDFPPFHREGTDPAAVPASQMKKLH